jgi:DNA-binding PadR family transcriptional regulator
MPKKHVASPPPESLLPLAPATFDILLALASGENHGYGIMKEIATRTNGAVQIGAGTLYGALKRLLASDVVEEIERDDSDDPGGRRRYYRLTAYGIEVARAESRRLEKAVHDARVKKLIPKRAG